MSVKPSKVRVNLDALLAFRAEGGSDLTATAASGVQSLDKLGARWNSDEIATKEQSAIAVFTTKLDTTTGDEVYDLEVQVDSTAAFGSPAVVKTVRVSKTGYNLVGLTREEILAADPDAAYIRINAKLAGTTPILNYYAYWTALQGQL